MAKRIYYLHSCNEWKEYSSMELLFIGTSQQKLKMKISKEIEEGNMEYKPITSRYDYVDGKFKLVNKNRQNYSGRIGKQKQGILLSLN